MLRLARMHEDDDPLVVEDDDGGVDGEEDDDVFVDNSPEDAGETLENPAPKEEAAPTRATASEEALVERASTESQMMLASIQSSQEARVNPTLCPNCGRLHHRRRARWTAAQSCNPVMGMDIDDDAEFVDFDGQAPDEDFLQQLPAMLIMHNSLRLIVMIFNLITAIIIGVYFDVQLHKIIQEHHPDLYPPPIYVQNLHFLIVVGTTFWIQERVWNRLLLAINA